MSETKPTSSAASSSATVAKQATQPDAVALNKTILIGVFGAGDDMSALVRLSSGSMRKVAVGDRLNWGRVSAIGKDRLMILRNGKNIVLELPAG